MLDNEEHHSEIYPYWLGLASVPVEEEIQVLFSVKSFITGSPWLYPCILYVIRDIATSQKFEVVNCLSYRPY